MLLADLSAAFERSELMPEAIDDVLRVLAEDGVEIVETGADELDEPRGDDGADSARRSGTSDLVADLPQGDRQGSAADGA